MTLDMDFIFAVDNSYFYINKIHGSIYYWIVFIFNSLSKEASINAKVCIGSLFIWFIMKLATNGRFWKLQKLTNGALNPNELKLQSHYWFNVIVLCTSIGHRASTLSSLVYFQLILQ